MIHTSPEYCKTWEYRGRQGFYVKPSLTHYRCLNVVDANTKHGLNSNTVEFMHEHLTNLIIKPEDRIAHALYCLSCPIKDVPSTVYHDQLSAILKLRALLTNKPVPEIAPPPNDHSPQRMPWTRHPYPVTGVAPPRLSSTPPRVDYKPPRVQSAPATTSIHPIATRTHLKQTLYVQNVLAALPTGPNASPSSDSKYTGTSGHVYFPDGDTHGLALYVTNPGTGKSLKYRQLRKLLKVGDVGVDDVNESDVYG